MDFEFSPRCEELRQELLGFMDSHIYPAEADYRDQMSASGDPNFHPPIVEELKAKARSLGLWNLFLPDAQYGAGLSNLDYAPLAEITGRSTWIAPEALNCSAPDTGNMEILAAFGSDLQKEQWLVPLLAGDIRSCFSMTEPDVASSDATNIRTRMERDGDDFVINGRKWWSSGAASQRCKVSIVMGVTDPEADVYHRQSMVLVPLDTPGVEIVRNLRVFGYQDRGGHPEISFTDVRVPAENLLGDQGGGFAIAQARLGPGRVHHCMRLIGMAERAFDHMCERALSRETFGSAIAEHGMVQDWIAEARIRIEQVRLLVLKTANARPHGRTAIVFVWLGVLRHLTIALALHAVRIGEATPWVRGRLLKTRAELGSDLVACLHLDRRISRHHASEKNPYRWRPSRGVRT